MIHTCSGDPCESWNWSRQNLFGISRVNRFRFHQSVSRPRERKFMENLLEISKIAWKPWPRKLNQLEWCWDVCHQNVQSKFYSQINQQSLRWVAPSNKGSRKTGSYKWLSHSTHSRKQLPGNGVDQCISTKPHSPNTRGIWLALLNRWLSWTYADDVDACSIYVYRTLYMCL